MFMIFYNYKLISVKDDTLNIKVGTTILAATTQATYVFKLTHQYGFTYPLTFASY